MKREKYFWKKLFCFVFLFTVVTGCGSVYAAEHGTAEEKETEDHPGCWRMSWNKWKKVCWMNLISDRSISYQERQNWEKSSVS